MRTSLSVALTLLFAISTLAAPVQAAPTPYQKASDKLLYEHCLSLASVNPAAALGNANDWIKSGGGAPAQHCAALSLVDLGRDSEAAAKLDDLAKGPDMQAFRVALFDQAGNAWMLAGNAPKAVASLQAALTLSSNDADLYADLARAQALQLDWKSVEADLNAALSLSPKRADLLVLRANARQTLGNLTTALADANAALALRPQAADALVERGTIRRDSGDLKGARSDFQAALQNGANGETADAARRNLAALDAAAAKPQAKPQPASKPKAK